MGIWTASRSCWRRCWPRHGNSALAVLYFGQLAERRGDDVRAVQSYQLLIDSPLALTARLAAAELLIKHGDVDTAMSLLDEYAEQNPECRAGCGRVAIHIAGRSRRSAVRPCQS